MTTLTEVEYVNGKGVICPVCHSSNVTAGAVEFDCGEVIQEVSCDSCGSTWRDVYALTGYVDLEESK